MMLFPFLLQIDPSILGGLVIEFGQKVFDMSIRTRARQMERLLKEPLNFWSRPCCGFSWRWTSSLFELLEVFLFHTVFFCFLQIKAYFTFEFSKGKPWSWSFVAFCTPFLRFALSFFSFMICTLISLFPCKIIYSLFKIFYEGKRGIQEYIPFSKITRESSPLFECNYSLH